MHVFPHKEPTQSNHRLWEEVIARLCNGSSSLPYLLGRYVRPPHLPLNWFTTHLSEALYRVQEDAPDTLYDVYHLWEGHVSTRHGRQYKWTGLATGTHPGTHYASVTMRSPIVAVLHSHAPFPSHPPSHTTLRKTLDSFGNPSLWINLWMDGDRVWVQQSLSRGALHIAHDGSYMPKKLVDMCSAAVVMYCQESKQWLKVSVVERSNKTCNYRGKLLGTVISLLIV